MLVEEVLTVPCELHQLARVGEIVRQRAEPVVGAVAAAQLDLAVTEVCSNIVRHGHPENVEHVYTVCLRCAAASFEIEIRDVGPPFDTLPRPMPDLDVPLEDLPEGGFGMALLNMTMDVVEFKRENGANVTRLVKRRPSPDAPVTALDGAKG